MFVCPFCRNFSAISYGSVLKHVEDTHQCEPGFQMRCQFCPQTYNKLTSYRSHLYRKHRDTPTSISDDHVGGDAGDMQLVEFDSPEEEGGGSSSGSVLQRRAAEFVLKARAERTITQASMNRIMEDIAGLVRQHVAHHQRSVQEALTGAGVDYHALPALEDIFHKSSLLSVFSGLETEWLQTKYFQEELRLLVPTERVLGQRLEQTPSGAHRTTFECCYDIPLLQTLQLLLHNRNVQNQVFNPHKTSDHRMRDYCDGSQFAEHPLFSTDPCALQIFLYYDDIDVCNPIGSKSTIHKLGIFYCCLGNIEPQLRSRLQSIFLLAVVEKSLVDKYGTNVILEPFVEDLLQLESDEGVPFEVNCQTRYLRGTLAIVPADNPASDLLGGYKSLHSAFRKCRDCLATSEDIQLKFTAEEFFHLQFTAEEFVPRTKATHKRHCSNLGGPLHSTVATTYGINEESILNTLNYYHVTSGLPPDVMHDILEGVAVVELRCMLFVFISEMNFFSLATLNSRIQSFPYGYPDITNKPTPLPVHFLTQHTTAALKQSASQTWCLIRLLPLIVGDLIPDGNRHWQNFLLLLKIVDYVCANESSLGIAGHLRDLINEHHISFRELYPQRPLTPKFHYVVHMPQWIMKVGPLIRSWCMRYEAKHRYFKRWAVVMGNFKNIAKTLAMHHQRYMCYQLLQTSTGGDSQYLAPTFSAGPATAVDLQDLSYQQLLTGCCSSLAEGSAVYRLNWVEVVGTRYTSPAIVVVCFQGDVPVFGQIQEIIGYGDQFYLVLKLMKAVVYNSHFHAYEVVPTSHLHVCDVTSLVDYHPLWLYQSFDWRLCETYFVPFKYYVLSDID